MSDEQNLSEEPEEAMDSEDSGLPSEEQLELAERIIARLNPPHRGAISQMIHGKAKTVGGIFAAYAVFWWLTVLQYDDTQFTSIFFGPDFMTVTILAPALIFLGSLLSDFSREMGELLPGLFSGIMFVLAILYSFEPVIMGFAGEIASTSDAVWKTSRLVILCLTVFFAAKLLIDAWLLGWVKALMETYPDLDFSEPMHEDMPSEAPSMETEA
tara:strand:- start:87 stop:725 length:639 start_codon:yes stop_codon:yes gene_type:complete